MAAETVTVAEAEAEAFAVALQAKDVERAEALLTAHPELALARLPSGLSLLMLAIYHRAQPLVDRMLALGAAPCPPEAAALGDVARLRTLAAAEPAAVAVAGADGFPPIHLAAHFGRADAVRALLELGADVAQRSTNGLANTPLHAAAAGGQDATVALLVEAGAPVDARDAQQNTPLMIAAANGLVESVRLLLARGADGGARNHEEKRAADLAQARGREEVLALLR